MAVVIRGDWPVKIFRSRVEIVTIADSFDALTTFRTYRPALSTAQAVKMIFEETGKQFDPQVYKAFVAAMPKIEKLRLRLQDNQATLGTIYGRRE